jgi:hypothetical protein
VIVETESLLVLQRDAPIILAEYENVPVLGDDSIGYVGGTPS